MNEQSTFPQSYQLWLAQATAQLNKNREFDPYINTKFEANLLLQAVTKRSKSAIFAFPETILTEAEVLQLDEWLVRRLSGEPIAHILGYKEFWSLPLLVSKQTLIPRPETELLVELALEWANKRLAEQTFLQILDLGTGTGAIALALASELGEKAKIVGVDKFPAVVALAQKNSQLLQLENAYFYQSDWFENIAQQHFDLIVSNPPYIDESDENLQWGDVRFEPRSALVAQNNGLADLQKIIENSPLYLCHNGALMLEHGHQQASQVQEIFNKNQWGNIQTMRDYSMKARVTWAIWNR